MIIHIFIINPMADGRDRSENIRKFLERKEGFEYLVFDTEGPGQEQEIMQKMLKLFEDDDVRFYICGGSGTFYNCLSAIEEPERVEIAHYPCGATNDFLKVFGRSRKLFYNMDNLIRGEVRPMDYIKCTDANAMIFASTGITARVEQIAHRYKLLMAASSGIAYYLAFFITFLWNPIVDYAVEIDGEDYSGEYEMIYVGNGTTMGGIYTPFSNADPTDGELEVLLLKKIPNIKLICVMQYFQKGMLDKLAESVVIKQARKISIRRKDEKEMLFNCDGEMIMRKRMQCEVVEGGINYVVPRGAVLFQK